MKNIIKRACIIIIALVIGLNYSITFAIAPNMDGWREAGKPTYLQGNTKFTNAADINGSNIMSRLRSSYTYNSRRTKVLNSTWVQDKIITKTPDNTNFHYTDITYTDLPNGKIGYTAWYDSPQGIFLDYETQFINGKIVDTSHGNVNPVDDSIYYNRIQYPGTQQNAYIGSTQVSGNLSDTKSAAILNRIGKTNYPIYLNNGKNLDSNISKELKDKNVRNLWILGGIERFNSTAGLSNNFNIIRIGGANRQETLEFMKDSPEKLKLPTKVSGDSNGIVVKGNLGWLQSSVYNKLMTARNNKDINSVISAADDILKNMVVGTKPSANQEPALVIGVNYQGWESYVSIYYSNIGGAYVYQFILPGYFDAYEPVNNWVDVSDVDYIDGKNYWVRPGKTFKIYTESRMKNEPYGLYPTNTEAILESWTNEKYAIAAHGLNSGIYTRESFDTDFNKVSGEKASKWQRNDSGTLNNYISGSHYMSAKYDNRDYKVSSNGYYVAFNSWIGSDFYHDGKWVKTDGTAPIIKNTYSSEWSNKDVKLSTSITDKRSGPKSVELYNSSNSKLTSGKESMTYDVKTEGVHKLKVKAKDNVGNESSSDITISIDKTAPSGTFNPNSKSWTKDNIIVNFNPLDNLSGVKQWRYATSNDNGSTYGSWSSYITGDTSKDITLSSEGTNKIKVEISDKAGNSATLYSGSYQIDKTAPSGIFNPNSKAWTRDNIIVNFNPSDNLSGVKQWRYATSNDNGKTYGSWSGYTTGDTSKDITLSSEGINKIKVEISDNAGNSATLTSGTYQIDKTAPTAMSYDVTDRQDDTFTIDIIGVTDNGGSGVRSEEVKVWVDTPTGRKEKLYTPSKVSDNNSKVVVNRLDFGGVTKTYHYELTLVDNVGNSRTYSNKTATMIQNNLRANRVDIYDPRDNRYVSQVISGLEYLAVVEIENTGEMEILKNFDVGFKIDGVENSVYTESSGIKKGQKKDYNFKFIAGEENLKGSLYEGIADYKDVIYETNENDNITTSKKPYDTPRSDENPPTIPIPPSKGEKIIDPPPIITVNLDLVAEDIDIVDLNSDSVITEVITEDKYRFRYKIKNNSSLALEYIDILNKSFTSKIYYDGDEIAQVNIDYMKKGEIKTFYEKFKAPLLSDDIVEAVKPIRLDVDTSDAIRETDEGNNSISKNKKIIGLKVIDYRITDSVNPIIALQYPIYTSSMPLRVKAGYNVMFKVNVLGKPDKVYSKIEDTNGKDYGIVEMTKVKDIDSIRSEWTYTFAPSMDTPDNTIVITQIYAKRNSFIYDYNLKENWNGNTLKIGGDAKDDIIIYRKY